ncbi:MAG: hypothetical protein M3Y87_02535 [Myxococcota bacterium]|nr:hypothetical protein [Myxococcota bacterium]
MTRTLPPIAPLAETVARMLGGVPRVLDAGELGDGELDDGDELGSAAVAFDGWHRVLIRTHVRSVSLSLPTEGSWSVQTPDDLRRIEPELRAALQAPREISMSDAIVGLAPIAARLTGSPWRVRFPGVPSPRESWMKHGEHSIGVFQGERSVRIVVWIGDEPRATVVQAPDALAALHPWLEGALRAQQVSLAAADAETSREAGRPLPDRGAVLAHLTRGGRIRTGGGRWYETFFWEGRLRREVFDEGATHVQDASEHELERAIESSPDAFRRALGLRS